MKVLPDNLGDLIMLSSVPQSLKDHITKIVDAIDKDHDDADGPMAATNFGWAFGGLFHIVELAEDLKEVQDTEMMLNNEAPDLTERAGNFDLCEYICDGEFVMIFLANNNAGGHTYFVPRELANKYPTIAESITNAAPVDESTEAQVEVKAA